MELRIINQPTVPEIQWNHEELITELRGKVEHYNSLVYTEEQVIEAKKDLSTLNNFRRTLDEKRKEVKNRCLLPYEVFERQMAEVMAVIDEPITAIKTQTDAFEEERKAKKADECRKLFAEAGFPDWVEFGKISKKRWLNKTVKAKEIKTEMAETLEHIIAAMTELDGLPEFAFEAKETYKKTLDINQAKSTALELARIQRLREEHTQKKTEATAQASREPRTPIPYNERQNTRTESEEAQNAPVQRQWIAFRANMSMDEAQALAGWLREHNIEFKPI